MISVPSEDTTVTPVETPDDEPALERLLSAYHAWMAGHDDRYDPDAELAEDLRSLSEEPDSWAWVARRDGVAVGCVLLYGETAELAEFKRLWVAPDARGEGIARALMDRVIERAGTEGYGTLGLTTPPWSEAAQALYEDMEFERVPPYPETRLPEEYHEDAIFMQRSL